jgi:hypothetical protein
MTNDDYKVDAFTVLGIIFILGLAYYAIFHEAQNKPVAQEYTAPISETCIDFNESNYNLNDIFELKRIQEQALATGEVSGMEVDLFQLILNKPGKICDTSLEATLLLLTQATECHRTFYDDVLKSFASNQVVVSPKRASCEAELYGYGSQQSVINNQNIQKALQGQPVSSEFGSVYLDSEMALSILAELDMKMNAVKKLYTQ